MANLARNMQDGGGMGGGSGGLAGPEGMTGAAIPPPEWANTTTVMMRNLPNKYTQRMLLTEINHTGFLGTFDFLYLPIDPETNANRGYSFLNFIDPGFAWMFKVTYEGRRMNRFNSNKVVSVMPATLQGFEANYAHYAAARVNRGDPAARPLFLREPKQPKQNNSVERGGGGKRRGGGAGGGAGAGRPPRGPGGSLDQQLMMVAQAQQAQAIATMAQAQQNLWGAEASYLGLDGGDVGPPYPGAGGGGGPPKAERGPPAPSSSSWHRLVTPQDNIMVPKFCPHCGGAIQPLFQFCPQCGASLDFGVSG
jgi:hypothetical protein